MPELPEIEIILRGIEPYVLGHTILYTKVRNIYLRWPVDKKIVFLKERKVLSLQRRAKYLLLELYDGWIIIHLGMSGSLIVLNKKKEITKHDHIDLFMSNGCILRYNDPRRFGAWLWSDDIRTNNLLSNLGIEPLSINFSYSWLFLKSRNKNTPIKIFIMNSKIIAGIGNIYANESLFLAGILPLRSAGSLNEKEITILVNSIKIILLRSIKYGGTSLRNFVQSNGEKGNFINELKVYGRSGQPCFICSKNIKKQKYFHRSNYFCSFCQK